MNTKYALIIDKRVEMSLKYKKTITHDCKATTEIVHELERAYERITEIEPDIILISDSIQEKFENIITKIRRINNYRPVIIALSKSSHLNDKLEALKNGADDFISEPIDISEFSARIYAHFRRHNEESSNVITNLPTENRTFKIIRRLVKSEEKWVMLFIDIDNFKYYHSLYGSLASDKMLKAYSAILKSAITEEDYLGQLNSDDFVIITTPYKSEKIATYLKMAFDAISSKFYSEEDADRGYIIMNSGGKIGRRIPVVTTSIGVISNEYRSYSSAEDILTHARDVHHLAKIQTGSNSVFDMPKISGSIDTKAINKIKRVLVVETDAALAYLLTTTLDLQGFETQATTNQEEAIRLCDEFSPNLVIFDAITPDFSLIKSMKSNQSMKNVKIIISTISFDKDYILKQGADLFLPKPYELITLFTWINKLLNEY